MWKGQVMKMKGILKRFLCDPGTLDLIMAQCTPEQLAMLHLVSEKRKVLEEKLDPEGRALLEDYLNAASKESSAWAYDRFLKGFEIGALIAMEMVEDMDGILSQ